MKLATVLCLLVAAGSAAAQDANDLDAARQGNSFASSQARPGAINDLVPGASLTPPQAGLNARDLRQSANAQVRYCATHVSDPSCAGIVQATEDAQRPRVGPGNNDPTVVGARQVFSDPGVALGGLGQFSGCALNGVCSRDQFCLGARCFSTRYTNDADFAQTMTFMEAVREAGVYLDPATTKVFSGQPNVCRDRLLKNCCYSDSAGASMSNQRLFTTGSRLVYDLLMNSTNRNFVKAGLTALMSGGGFTGTYSTFGISVAVNGSSLPAGSMVLGSGENYVIAIDPWSLAITATIFIVAELSQCSKAESLAALKEGAHLCHSIGTWCSECFRVLGHCVSCIERSTGKCCFNSRLARMINEQGRQQLGLGWGTPERPACDGFTVADLQRLDFSRMDLTEFYDSIVPSMPNVPAMQAGARERAANCYRGGGKC
ncbi:hypothetical protein E4L96_20055 [Massilia arenosa]|uniref:Conjugal transfer protein TraN n=1 Tax=Zemynaea arenosa TaxID=2561931 RepID=A0A4Y9RWN9_9BURK|nr:conjugal transfer protein TraN [Massilia arenosa]TFW13392.1 hypothetical protein E4L96_20055 [Massilia arenosa]